MTAFEHVMTLVSFVFALAVTHLLTFFIALVRAGSRVRYSFAHAAWVALSLLLILAWWLGMWDFHALKSWDVGTIGFTLGSIICYIFTGLLCQEIPEEGPVDLVEFHRTHARQYIGAYIAAVAVGTGYGLYYGYFDHIAEQDEQVFVGIRFWRSRLPAMHFPTGSCRTPSQRSWS